MLYRPRRLWSSNPNTTVVLPPKRFQQYYGSTGKEGFEKQCKGRERSVQRFLHTDNPWKERRVTTGEANRLFIRGEINSKGISWQRHQKGHLPKVKWGLKWNKLRTESQQESGVTTVQKQRAILIWEGMRWWDLAPNYPSEKTPSIWAWGG